MRRQSLEQLHRTAAGGPPYAAEFLHGLAQDSRAGAQLLLARCQRKLDAAAAEEAHRHALLAFERTAREAGHEHIAGVDEAGRGPLAGPIVAAAVILRDDAPAGLNDSKQLREDQRNTIFDALHAGGHAIGVAVIEPQTIDAWGIQQANMTAMRRAVEALSPSPDYLLVDGFALPGSPCAHERIIKGDARSLSIAAASVIAKVTRDRLMLALDCAYPGYGFAQHKGYGTAAHLDAIARLGPCPAHRTSFAPIAQAAGQSPLFAHLERTPPACAHS